MRKYVLSVFGVLLFFISAAQPGVKVNFGGSRPQDTAWAARPLRVDDNVQFTKYATGDTNIVAGFDGSGNIVARKKGTALDTAAMLAPYASKAKVLADSIALAGQTNQRVKYSDTAAMLISYVNKAKGLADSIALASQINQRLKYIDTASMLAPYATDQDLTAKENISNKTTSANGTSNFLYPTQGAVKSYVDEQDALNLKYSDTAAMLNPYALKAKVLTDSTALAGQTNQRVKYTDTAAMLSPYLRIAVAALTYAPISTTVTLTGAQTLTNKTITSPSVSTPLITGLSSGSINDSLLVADASTGAVKRISSSRISGGGGGTPSLAQVLAVGNNANNRIRLRSDTTSFGGGFAKVLQLESTNFPAFTLEETTSGSGNGWGFGVESGFNLRMFPLVPSCNEVVKLGSAGVLRGISVQNNCSGAGIHLQNTVSGGKEWNIMSVGSGYSAPTGSLAWYGGDAGYAFTMTKDGNVSIGFAYPTSGYRLDVNGNIGTSGGGFFGTADGSNLILKKGTTQVLQLDGTNVNIGDGSTTVTGQSTGIGRGVISTGDENVSIGSRSSSIGTLTSISIGGYGTAANKSYAICIGKLSASAYEGAFVMHDNQPEAAYSAEVVGGWKTKFSGGYKFQIGTTSITTSLEILSSGKLKAYNVPTYVDNAAAISGGESTSTIYKTPTGQLMIVY